MVDKTKKQSENETDDKTRELQQAIEQVNKGLEDLSPEELSRIYSILKFYSGEQNTAGEAFAKLDTFTQKQVNDFAEGKTKVAPEDLIGMQKQEAEIATVHKSQELPATERAKRELREFEVKHNLTHLSATSKPQIDKNLAEMDAMLEGFDAFARQQDGSLRYPEMANVDGFFEHLDIKVGEEGAKDKDELRREMLEMAILQAESELAVNHAFAGLSAAEKRKRLLQAIGSHADAMALEMLKAQFLADFQAENAKLLAHKDNLTQEEEKELEKKIREFNDKVKIAARGCIERKYPSGHYSLSSTNATAVIIANSRNQVAVNNRIAEKTGHTTLKERALKFDAVMKEKHPKLYYAIKKGMVSGVLGVTTGGVGLAGLAVYNTGKLIQTSYKTYKDSGFDGSYLEYLKNNKKELLSLTTSVVLTGVSVYFGGSDVVQHGWNAVGMVGRAIGDTAAAKAGDRLMKAAIRGTISITSGLANASMDFRAALNEQDKSKRKQLFKQAAMTAGISVVAGAAGMLSAEYGGKVFGWLKDRFFGQDNGVDGITGAAPKVSNVHTQSVQHTPDMPRLNENQIDAKLHELGVNPKVYEEMSPMQKKMLLHKRIEELGPLAKETSENSTTAQNAATAQNADTGPVSEAQFKNILTRNAERHPDVDMNKVYEQLKAAGIKNPEESFYKLEQARLLAPDDKIMTVDGTNIRDTFSRALKGEALSKADMEIINRSMANVDNTGHYLNDVRSQGGTGYSYRPNGQVITNEQSNGENIVKPKDGQSENQSSYNQMLDIEKMSEADRELYKSMMAHFQDRKIENWQFEANKAYLDYCRLRTDGKMSEADEIVKKYLQPEGQEQVDNKEQQDIDENKDKSKSIYQAEKGDSKALIAAKIEAEKAKTEWRIAVSKVEVAEKELAKVEDLPPHDPRRIEAEYKHAEAMKDEVKKQMDFSKKELKLDKAEYKQLGDEIENRKKMEVRMTEINKELKLYGIDKNDAPTMTGDYDADRRAVREYYKDVLSNKKNQASVMKLLTERDKIYSTMKEQGPRPLMEEKYKELGNKINETSKRDQYNINEKREEAFGSPKGPSITESFSKTNDATPLNKFTAQTTQSGGR